MTSTALYTVLGLLFAQGCNGGMMDLVTGGLEEQLNEMVAPLMSRTQDLQDLVALAKKEHGGLSKWHINFEACANMTDRLSDAELLIKEIITNSSGLFKNITHAANELLDCPTKGVVHIAQCILNNLDIIRTGLLALRPTVEKYKEEIEDMYIEVHAKFLECIGFEPPSKLNHQKTKINLNML